MVLISFLNTPDENRAGIVKIYIAFWLIACLISVLVAYIRCLLRAANTLQEFKSPYILSESIMKLVASDEMPVGMVGLRQRPTQFEVFLMNREARTYTECRTESDLLQTLNSKGILAQIRGELAKLSEQKDSSQNRMDVLFNTRCTLLVKLVSKDEVLILLKSSKP
jgi:hypothetical protein